MCIHSMLNIYRIDIHNHCLYKLCIHSLLNIYRTDIQSLKKLVHTQNNKLQIKTRVKYVLLLKSKICYKKQNFIICLYISKAYLYMTLKILFVNLLFLFKINDFN